MSRLLPLISPSNLLYLESLSTQLYEGNSQDRSDIIYAGSGVDVPTILALLTAFKGKVVRVYMVDSAEELIDSLTPPNRGKGKKGKDRSASSDKYHESLDNIIARYKQQFYMLSQYPSASGVERISHNILFMEFMKLLGIKNYSRTRKNNTHGVIAFEFNGKTIQLHFIQRDFTNAAELKQVIPHSEQGYIYLQKSTLTVQYKHLPALSEKINIRHFILSPKRKNPNDDLRPIIMKLSANQTMSKWEKQRALQVYINENAYVSADLSGFGKVRGSITDFWRKATKEISKKRITADPVDGETDRVTGYQLPSLYRPAKSDRNNPPEFSMPEPVGELPGVRIYKFP